MHRTDGYVKSGDGAAIMAINGVGVKMEGASEGKEGEGAAGKESAAPAGRALRTGVLCAR